VSYAGYPAFLVFEIFMAVATSPGAEDVLIASRLPYLLEYVSKRLDEDPIDYAYFKQSFIKNWQKVLPDIPLPDFEGSLGYEAMIRRFMAHLHSYRDRLYAMYGEDESVKTSIEVKSVVASLVNKVLFYTVLDMLKFWGDI
jgi:hypothetical protein